MRPDVLRRPRHAAPSSRLVSAFLSALLLVGFVSLPAPKPVLAASPMAAACDGVQLRTSPLMSDAIAATVSAGTQVGVESTVIGDPWIETCAGNVVSGDSWYQISELNGQSIFEQFGVPFVYSATGLFQPVTTPTPSPSYLEGIDVSKWQGSIDWNQVAGAGKKFAMIRASAGSLTTDEWYTTNRAGANAALIPMGAYHYANPDSAPNDALNEANFFLSLATPVRGDLVPALDVEVTNGLSVPDMQAWVRTWLERVTAVTGVRPMIYTSPNFWENAMGDTTWFAANGYRTLWVAHWTSDPAPLVPAENWGGNSWTFWQYTSSGSVPGISGRVDLNRYNGLDLSPVLLTSSPIDPPVPTAVLTITPSSSVITWGETVVVNAAFGASGAYRTFALQGARDGITWEPIATQTTDAGGNASFSYRPANNLYYRGVFDGAPDLAAVTSDTARVVVRQIALLRPTANGGVKVVSRGRKVTFTTTVRPSRADLPTARVTFAVYRRVGSRWVLFTNRDVYVNSAGQASYTWTFATRGEWYVRSIANPTTFNANSTWSSIERYSVR